jgi:hypothetical protein
MLLSNLKMCLAAVIAATVLTLATGGAQADPIVKQGVPLNEVQLHFNDFTGQGYMPVYARPYVTNGQVLFDFTWEVKDNSQWELRHMIADQDWAQKDSDMRTLGFSRVCSTHYFVNGQKYHCTLWRK